MTPRTPTPTNEVPMRVHADVDDCPPRMTMIAPEAAPAADGVIDAPLRMTMTLDAEPLPMRRARGTEEARR